MNRRKTAQWAGWQQYRYGSAQPVSVARIFTGKDRRQMVSRALPLLKDWRLSPFEHEGSVVAGLRSGLCLNGHPWAAADNEAHALVGEALHRMNAKRPSELQGQREYTIPVENCQRCGGDLDDADIARHRRFCCDECRESARVNNAVMHKIVTRLARGAAWYVAQKQKLPERRCEWCEKLFRPGTLQYYRKTDTCSPECAQALVASRQEPRQCAHCDTWFKPVVGHGKFCSVECRDQHRKDEKAAATAERLAPRPCEQCGRTFEPTRADQQFCGVRCNWQHQNEKAKARRRENLLDKACEQCGELFDALKSSARFCSVKCRNRFNYIRQAEQKEASRFACEEVFLEAAE